MRWMGLERFREILRRLGWPLPQALERRLVTVRAGREDEWRRAGVGASLAGVLGERGLV
ncbi:MAG TPA: hypothetical protein VFS20_10840 [Longimicrobium sp.]|nr:hypothetical protein [Longimicrobium sp.]